MKMRDPSSADMTRTAFTEKRDRGPGMVRDLWRVVVMQLERSPFGLFMRAGASLAGGGDRINVVPRVEDGGYLQYTARQS